MGNIKLENGQMFPDRRQNGARIKLDIGDWIKIISVIIVFILGVGNVKWTVNNHSSLLAQCIKDINENGRMTRDNYKDIENIKEIIRRIDKNVLELLKNGK